MNPMEIIDIADDTFIDGDGEVISYKGDNFYKACGREVEPLSTCVRRIHHGGMYCEDYDGALKLREEATGEGDLSPLTVLYPRMAPTGAPITKSILKAAWGKYITPLQSSDGDKVEFQTLAAVFRHVYGALPEDVEVEAAVKAE